MPDNGNKHDRDMNYIPFNMLITVRVTCNLVLTHVLCKEISYRFVSFRFIRFI